MKSEKKRSKKSLAVVLTVMMVLSVCAVIPAMGNGEPLVMRIIEPSTVSPGEDFSVMVIFSGVPLEDITSVAIFDKLDDPDDWNICIYEVTPNPLFSRVRGPPNNTVAVTWAPELTEPISSGSVTYHLTAPGDAEGDYYFRGELKWDGESIDTTDPNDHVTVEVPDEEPPEITSVASSSITTDSATIAWNTDEDSDSLVKYGTASGVYTMEKDDAADVTAHSIGLTGLSADTTYYYVVNSTDPSDNSAESEEYSFTTLAAPDEEPPEITSVASSSITTDSATITWDTGENSDSLVKYGTASGVYTMEEDDATEVMAHSIDLTGLSADTTYYYVVNSTDPSDNSAESGEYSFTTEAEGDTEPPIVTNPDADPYIIPEDTDSEPLWGELSNLSVVVTDDNAIVSVTINLSSIGGSAVQAMTPTGDNVWYYETNASIDSAIFEGANGGYVAHLLQVNATDEHGYSNMSVSIDLMVMKNGDIDKDGDVDFDDGLYLVRHTLNIPGYKEELPVPDTIADVDGDGEPIDFDDGLYLVRHTLNIPGYKEGLR